DCKRTGHQVCEAVVTVSPASLENSTTCQRITLAGPFQRAAGHTVVPVAPHQALRRVAQEECRDLTGRHGPGEQITLRNVASEDAHGRELIVVLHALGYDGFSQTVR